MRYNFIWADRSYYQCHTGLCLAILKKLDKMEMEEVICSLKLIQKYHPNSISNHSDLKILFDAFENYNEFLEDENADDTQTITSGFLEKALRNQALESKVSLEEYAKSGIEQYKSDDLIHLSEIGKIININFELEDYYEQSTEFSLLSNISSAISHPNKLLMLDYRKMEKGIPNLVFDELTDEFNLKNTYSYPLFTLPVLKNSLPDELLQVRRNLLPAFKPIKQRLKQLKEISKNLNFDKDFHELVDFYNAKIFPAWCGLQPYIQHDPTLERHYQIFTKEPNNKLSLSMTLNILPLKAILEYFVRMDIIQKGHEAFIQSILPGDYNENTPVPFISLSFGQILWNQNMIDGA